jgi:NAD(P)-dependent dehydrogenase (short-subunit alcohol dehydrogenase family)
MKIAATARGRSIVSDVSPLDGKIAVVTGTSRGVGVGIAHELLRPGRPWSAARGNRCRGSPASAEHPGLAARSSQRVCDQGDYRAIDEFVADVVADTYGRIDILVNNAGGTVPTPHVEDVPELVAAHPGRAPGPTTSSARCCSTPSPSR